MNQQQRISTWLTFICVFALFSCSLFVNKFVNSCFYVILLISLSRLVFDRQAARDCWSLCKEHWIVCSAMTAPLVALLIHQVVRGEMMLRLYDLPARLAVFALIFCLLTQLSTNQIRTLKWGFIIGTLLYTIRLYIDTQGGHVRVSNINSFSIIFSSELGFLMGMFSILSIHWTQRRSKLILIGQVIAGLCGLYAVYLSQTRGAWLAIPLFVIISISTLMHTRQARTKMLLYIGIVATLLLMFAGTNIVQERIEEARHDITEFTGKDNLDTSVGVRLQLWNASWTLFKEHPLLGVGKENFSSELHNLQSRGLITEAAAEQYHSHNEALYSMATMGVIGLIALLIVYLVPITYFGRFMFHPDMQIHSAAAMGLCLCSGYMVFGLVDVMFGWNMCNVFYSVAIALFMAFIVNRNADLQSQQA